jgi:hypothetical protein
MTSHGAENFSDEDKALLALMLSPCPSPARIWEALSTNWLEDELAHLARCESCTKYVERVRVARDERPPLVFSMSRSCQDQEPQLALVAADRDSDGFELISEEGHKLEGKDTDDLGKVILRFVGNKVPKGHIELLIDGKLVHQELPFGNGNIAVVSKVDLDPVLSGGCKLDVHVQNLASRK